MKKLGKFMKKNTKLVVAFILGVILTGTGVYAASVASITITYDNEKSGLAATTVQGAIDEIHEKSNVSHCPTNNTTEAVTFKLGDYVKMTPTSSSFTTSTTYTGNYNSETINPSELNLWRVIRINSDSTVDMVSEYVSSSNITFNGLVGYQYYIYYLNKIAHQYENSCYTIDSRHVGYSNQNEFIKDEDMEPTPLIEESTYTDCEYQIDYDLINDVYGTLTANNVNTMETANYFLASRPNIFSSSSSFLSGGYITTAGKMSRNSLGSCSYSDYTCKGSGSFSGSIRPIVTLKPEIKASSGDGSSATPYVLD